MKRLAGGFTIAELMIATAVFSIIMLVGAEGVIQLGRNYYKGVTVTQTGDVAKNIVNDVSANIRLSSSVSPLGTASSSRDYYCVGSTRYTFILFNKVDTSNHDNTNKFGLLEDEPKGQGCGNPFDGNTAVPLVNPVEILGNQMRLLAFSITPVTGSIYSVKVTVASGNDDTLTSPISATSRCMGSLSVGKFCAVTNLTAAVYEGVSI